MITRRKILSWLGIASAALGSTVRSSEARADPVSVPGRTFHAKPRPYVADSGLSDPVISELRKAWRYDFEGDHKYAAIRRCLGLRKMYYEGRISREEFQALLPHNLRHKLGHLRDLPWPDAGEEVWTRDVTSRISPV